MLAEPTTPPAPAATGDSPAASVELKTPAIRVMHHRGVGVSVLDAAAGLGAGSGDAFATLRVPGYALPLVVRAPQPSCSL